MKSEARNYQDQVRKILVVTLSNLGDVVLTLPVFQSLARAFPEAELHVVVGAAGREVFEGDPRIQKIIVFDKKMPPAGKLKFLMTVRREQYDLIVDLRRSLIGLLGGARYRNPYFGFTKEPIHRAQKHLFSLRNIVVTEPYEGGVAAPSTTLEGRLRQSSVADRNDR